MSFKDYFESIKKKPTELRMAICEKLQISQETFYSRYRNDDFTYPEKVVIAEIIGQPIDELFPENK